MTYQLAITLSDEVRELELFALAEETPECAIQFCREHWEFASSAERAKWQAMDLKTPEGDRIALWSRESPAAESTEDTAGRVVGGHYAVDGCRYFVTLPKKGKWAGWTFLATGSDYNDRKTMVMVKPGGAVVKASIRGRQVWEAIVADPLERIKEYGQITGTCGVCGRKLENPESRALGIGPVCLERLG